MLLACEIPTHYLLEWNAMTDLDFVLAHRVLEDEGYARFHRNRRAARELILDNSLHELGASLPIADLLRAAQLVRADYVISPDRFGDPDWTIEQYWQLQEAAEGAFCLGVVLHGQTEDERRSFLQDVNSADMLCLPYRANRLAWYEESREYIHDWWFRIHLLGVNTLDELRSFAAHSKKKTGSQSRVARWSVDTSKPIKLGIDGRRIDDGVTLRGASTSSKELLGITELSEAQRELCEHNLDYLHSFVS